MPADLPRRAFVDARAQHFPDSGSAQIVEQSSTDTRQLAGRCPRLAEVSNRFALSDGFAFLVLVAAVEDVLRISACSFPALHEFGQFSRLESYDAGFTV